MVSEDVALWIAFLTPFWGFLAGWKLVLNAGYSKWDKIHKIGSKQKLNNSVGVWQGTLFCLL